MKLKVRKFRFPSSTTISLAALAGFTGFELIESWLRHAPSTFRHGVYFALALIMVIASAFILIERDKP
jgi:hypothetical protein